VSLWSPKTVGRDAAGRVSLRALLLLVFVLFVSGERPAQALLFNLTDGAELAALQSTNFTLYNQVRGGFNSASSLWSSLLNNNVTVNITINYRSLGANILGQTSNVLLSSDYTTIRTQLAVSADPLSSIDQTALASLPLTTPTYTVRNPNVAVDTGNLVGTKANLKALGFTGLDAGFGARDASITFSSDFAFDFDRSDGIAGNLFDFVGIAAHEIGHSLGFVSIVDTVDAGATIVTPRIMDLYRFSSAGVRDLSADNIDKYFSVNGGFGDANGGGIDLYFSNGLNQNDMQQASHWRDHLGIGMMDPTAGNGELLAIADNDLMMFDAIGWNRTAAVNVPEPATLSLVLLGFGTVVPRRRRA
jgi:hypothetical protein